MIPVATSRYPTTAVDDAITLVKEPYVDPLLRANIWHVRGRGRDLLVDCGLGVVPLRSALPELFEREPVLVLTHAHLDHRGAAHEFVECWAHPAEPVGEPGRGSLDGAVLAVLLGLSGEFPPSLISARPDRSYDPRDYELRPARVTRQLREGDVVDLGDRRFSVLHLPGHGRIGHDGDVLFSGDALYDDELIDDAHGSDAPAYRHTMCRLRALPVRVVHGGHAPSFGATRMRELIDAYLEDGAP